MSILKVNSIEPANAGSEDYFLARAWVNFTGTGTVAINNDGNVSSVTDNAVGDYSANFGNLMTSARYAVAPYGRQAYSTAAMGLLIGGSSTHGLTTSYARLEGTDLNTSGLHASGDQEEATISVIL